MRSGSAALLRGEVANKCFGRIVNDAAVQTSDSWTGVQQLFLATSEKQRGRMGERERGRFAADFADFRRWMGAGSCKQRTDAL